MSSFFLKKYLEQLFIYYVLLAQKELRPSIDRIRKYVENLKSLGEG